MLLAMEYRGPDGRDSWSDEQVSLGHLMLRTTKESLEETQPLANEDQSIVLTLDGYLTNCVELRGQLLDRGVHLRTNSDAELVLRAYEAWGRDCPRHIDGEYAFVIWNAHLREVFCARDHQGLRPLFYCWDGKCLLVASDIAGIVAALGSTPCLNQAYIAEMMAEEWLSRTETVWSGIKRLQPAHSLRLAQDKIETEAYWTLPLEVNIQYPDERDYLEHYRELLLDCIRRSSRSLKPLAFEVSGGLDSTALFCLADKEQGAGRLHAPDIMGFTLRGPAETDADEIKFVEATESYTHRHIEKLPLYLPGINWFARQARLDWDVPCYPNGAMSIGLEQAAREKGCRVIINGVGGDQWLDGSTFYYTEQLSKLDWSGLANSFRADSKALGWTKTIQLFLKAIAANSAPEPFLRLARRLLVGRSEPPDWLSQQAKSTLAQRRRDTETRLRQSGRWHYKENKLNFAFHLHGLDLMNRQRARSGLESRSPFLMRPFIEFSAQTPEHLRLQGGITKQIHRKALRDDVPEFVLQRTSKAEFGVAWQEVAGDLISWLQPHLHEDLGPNLAPASVEHLLAGFDQMAFDDRPYWELWAIFVATVLAHEAGSFNSKTG